MSLRILDIVVSKEQRERIRKFFEDAPYLDQWETPLMDGKVKCSILLEASQAEEVMDLLTEHFESDESFRIVVQTVETSIPRKEEKPSEPEELAPVEEPKVKTTRISRDELYDDISDASRISRTYIALVIFSTIVAAVGLMKDNLAVIIGAMVIAPLLGPNVALSLATTLGDLKLTKRAIRVNALGIAVAFVVAALIGFLFKPDPSGHELAIRTSVSFADLALALVAGAAGSLAFTTGISSALVGVMVAVALLPPLVACGLLAGSGQWNLATGALLLLLTNLICINLSGVLTFVLQGIKPRTWYEAEIAQKATRNATIIWFCLLIVLAVVLLLAKLRWIPN